MSLEMTFREPTPPPGAAAVRATNRSHSPKPRTGWYPRRSKRGGGLSTGRGSATGSTAEGWASTDADRKALRWQSLGSGELSAFEMCTLVPWLGGSAALDEGGGAGGAGGTTKRGLGFGGGAKSVNDDGRWSEIGVYPPGDDRKRREALLMGFQPAEASSTSGDGGCGGYVVAHLVEVRPEGGVSVVEMCRTPLQAGQEPVYFNREKVPPGAPTTGRAAAEAMCADGWVRRWSVTRAPLGFDESAGDSQSDRARFSLSRVDICRPFQTASESQASPPQGGTAPPPPAIIIAFASPTLLAVARSTESPSFQAPVRSFSDISRDASAPSATASEAPPALEVWSCSVSPYPRGPFKNKDPVALPWLRAGQAVEGMCWVSPEAGDERGAAVCGHCLCVSVEGSVTVLAREKRQKLPALPGLVLAPEVAGGEGEGWTWSPVFRVTNPSSLLTCRTAGLRDFCQVSERRGLVLRGGFDPAHCPPMREVLHI